MVTRPNPMGNRPRPQNKPILRKTAKVLPASVVKALLKMKIAREEKAKQLAKEKQTRRELEELKQKFRDSGEYFD